ncbi:MAG: SDR family NAD(P)-dependent oxidoreductase [Acidobacteriia bacterium]|nr:SDR family NAD(P)-dependent oxidoreductase [Terriglobia bacterium]
MMELRNSVAVITGAGSGIGRALAQELASLGAQLALADVNSAAAEETRGLLGPVTARTYTVDVGDAAAMEAFARRVEQDFGRATILVNNAGVALFGTFDELTVPEIEWLFRINFWGVVHGCKFFLPLLRREKDARIVNISSVLGMVGTPGQSAYCASKFAVRGLSEVLREELRAANVSVTCVHPAGISTKIALNARAGAATRAEDQEQAQARFAKVLQISPQAAAQTIVRGVLKNRDRVLIGADAHRIDFFTRLMPVRASAVLTKWMQKRIEEPERAPEPKNPEPKNKEAAPASR